jgi:NDP-sugar pyrophosphorylase family protein
MQYHLDRLFKFGVREVLINIHYLPEKVQAFIDEYSRINPGMKVTMVYEPELLGSAGTLRANREFFSGEEEFMISYSDNFTNIDYDKFFAKHSSKKRLATIAAYFEEHPESKGIIEHDDREVITKFVEKPKPEQITTHWANAGMYIVDKEVFEFLSQLEIMPLDFGKDLFPYLLEKRQEMDIYFMDEYLLDIGTLDKYEQAQIDVKKFVF